MSTLHAKLVLTAGTAAVMAVDFKQLTKDEASQIEAALVDSLVTIKESRKKFVAAAIVPDQAVDLKAHFTITHGGEPYSDTKQHWSSVPHAAADAIGAIFRDALKRLPADITDRATYA